MTEVAKLVTEITANATDFLKSVDDCKASSSSLAGAVGIASAAAVIAFTAVAAAATFVGDSVLKSAEKIAAISNETKNINVTVAAFQQLSISAKEAGVGSSELASLLEKLNKNLGAAQLGGGTAGKALAALGLSLRDLSELTTDQKFELISKKLATIKDVTLETKVATDLFGKAGAGDLALFNSNLDALGIGLTDGQAAAIKSLNDTKDLLGSVWDGFKDNVAANLAPAFKDFFDYLLQSIDKMGGLKTIASEVSEYIVGAMKTMGGAINFALNGIQTAKNVIGSLGIDKLYEIAKLPSQLAIGAITGIGKALLGGNQSDSLYAAVAGAPTPLSGASSQAEAAETAARLKSTASISDQTAITKRVTDAYADHAATVKLATESLKAIKKSSLEAAGALDKLNTIKSTIDAGDKGQAKRYIDNATGSNKTPADLDPVFQSKVSKIVSEINTGALEAAADGIKAIDQAYHTKITASNMDYSAKSSVPKRYYQDNPDGTVTPLNGDYLSTPLGDRYSGNKEDFEKPYLMQERREAQLKESTMASDKQDPNTGMAEVVQQLKGFLAQKTLPEQKVTVSIEVAPSQYFVTTVAQSQTFTEAVNKEFDSRIAAAARATAP
jgi:hypothetical protein